MSNHSSEATLTKKELLDHAWVGYISPYSFVVPDNEKPLEITLDEINYNRYDYSSLCRIVARLPVSRKGLEQFRMLVCYDGALAVPRHKTLSLKEQAIDYFGEVLCNFLIGGIYCEAIDTRDIVWGQLHNKKFIWLLDMGESVSSQLHGSLRIKAAGPLQTILLSSPRIIRVSELEVAAKIGAAVTSKIHNFSPQFLIRGVTELHYRNWSAALSNLWICVEQLTEFLWERRFLGDSTNHPKKPIAGRLKTLQEDTRTYSISVKQEILFQDAIIDEETLTRMYPARKARNYLVHQGKSVDMEVALGVFEGICRMLTFCVDIVDLPLGRTFPRDLLERDKQPKSIETDEVFQEWLSLS